MIQRGVDRRPCFVLEVHYQEYLRHLTELAQRLGCQIHAYALMGNHVHLLVTPAEAGGIGRLMQAIGRRYVAFFNYSMERTGTLWEGRFKSCLVDSNAYVLRCYRYIELNPVRAAIVSNPAGFAWSSYRCNGLGEPDALVTPHFAYQSLGDSIATRLEAYRMIVGQGCPHAEADEIRAMTSRQRAFGSRQFKEQLEAVCERPMGLAKRGRPRLEVK